MKSVFFALVIVAALLAGCRDKAPPQRSGEASPPSPAITVEFGQQTFAFDPAYAKFATLRHSLILSDSAIANRAERVPATVHRIYLANYNLQLTDPARQDYRPIDAAGQFRVEIQIEAERDAPVDAPIRPGEYGPAPTPFERVSWVGIARYGEAGTMLAGSRAAGTVRIVSVTDSEITVEIDFSDTDGRVQGSFTAQRLQELS